MEDRLIEELENKYCGMKVNTSDDNFICNGGEDVLIAEFTDEDDQEFNLSMGISLEIDEDDCISEIDVYFHTSAWGDSGLGECDPDEYFEYEECLEAAENHIKEVIG